MIGLLDENRYVIVDEDFVEILKNNKSITFKFPDKGRDPLFKFNTSDFNKVYNKSCK